VLLVRVIKNDEKEQLLDPAEEAAADGRGPRWLRDSKREDPTKTPSQKKLLPADKKMAKASPSHVEVVDMDVACMPPAGRISRANIRQSTAFLFSSCTCTLFSSSEEYPTDAHHLAVVFLWPRRAASLSRCT
jgi:hypothetical protein